MQPAICKVTNRWNYQINVVEQKYSISLTLTLRGSEVEV